MGLRADLAICPIAAGAITSRCYFPLVVARKKYLDELPRPIRPRHPLHATP